MPRGSGAIARHGPAAAAPAAGAHAPVTQGLRQWWGTCRERNEARPVRAAELRAAQAERDDAMPVVAGGHRPACGLFKSRLTPGTVHDSPPVAGSNVSKQSLKVGAEA